MSIDMIHCQFLTTTTLIRSTVSFSQMHPKEFHCSELSEKRNDWKLFAQIFIFIQDWNDKNSIDSSQLIWKLFKSCANAAQGLDWIGGGWDHQDGLMRVIIDPPGGVCRYYFQHLIVTNRSFIAWNKAKTKQSRAGAKILYLTQKLNIWWFWVCNDYDYLKVIKHNVHCF